MKPTLKALRQNAGQDNLVLGGSIPRPLYLLVTSPWKATQAFQREELETHLILIAFDMCLDMFFHSKHWQNRGKWYPTFESIMPKKAWDSTPLFRKLTWSGEDSPLPTELSRDWAKGSNAFHEGLQVLCSVSKRMQSFSVALLSHCPSTSLSFIILSTFPHVFLVTGTKESG